MDIIINSIGDFMLQLAVIMPNNPMLGFLCIISMPLIFVFGAILKTGK
jgi:hypothetical protein